MPTATGPWSNRGLSKGDHERHKEQASSRYSGGKGYLTDVLTTFVPREGQNKVRIVEPLELDDIGWYSVEVSFHRNVGFDRAYYLCNAEMKIGSCYHSEMQTEELWDTDPDEAKGYYPDRRTLMLVLDLISDDPNKLKKWSCPNGLADEIVNQCHESETDTYRSPAAPETGPPVFFTRTGQGLHTKYTGVQIGTQALPLTDHHANQRVPFTDLIIVPTSEEVKAAFLNQQEPDRMTEPSPPVKSYEQDIAADKTGSKYQQPPAKKPEREIEEDEQASYNPIDTAQETACKFLASLDREGLKQFKVKYKQQFKELTFTIYKTTPDAEIAESIAAALFAAEHWVTDMGEVVPLPGGSSPQQEIEEEYAGGESEPEQPTQQDIHRAGSGGSGGSGGSSDQPPSVAGSQDREKTDVKAAMLSALAAAIGNRSKQ